MDNISKKKQKKPTTYYYNSVIAGKRIQILIDIAFPDKPQKVMQGLFGLSNSQYENLIHGSLKTIPGDVISRICKYANVCPGLILYPTGMHDLNEVISEEQAIELWRKTTFVDRNCSKQFEENIKNEPDIQ